MRRCCCCCGSRRTSRKTKKSYFSVWICISSGSNGNSLWQTVFKWIQKFTFQVIFSHESWKLLKNCIIGVHSFVALSTRSAIHELYISAFGSTIFNDRSAVNYFRLNEKFQKTFSYFVSKSWATKKKVYELIDLLLHSLMMSTSKQFPLIGIDEFFRSSSSENNEQHKRRKFRCLLSGSVWHLCAAHDLSTSFDDNGKMTSTTMLTLSMTSEWFRHKILSES